MSRPSSITAQILINSNIENHMRNMTFSSISQYVAERDRAQQFFNEHPNWVDEDPVLRHLDRRLANTFSPNWRNNFSPDGCVNLKFVENSLLCPPVR